MPFSLVQDLLQRVYFVSPAISGRALVVALWQHSPKFCLRPVYEEGTNGKAAGVLVDVIA